MPDKEIADSFNHETLHHLQHLLIPLLFAEKAVIWKNKPFSKEIESKILDRYTMRTKYKEWQAFTLYAPFSGYGLSKPLLTGDAAILSLINPPPPPSLSVQPWIKEMRKNGFLDEKLHLTKKGLGFLRERCPRETILERLALQAKARETSKELGKK